ncbi:MAG: ATP-binding protein [Clostridia bacterium]|nr:ATP-binding protein [Clostridia bacterium]
MLLEFAISNYKCFTKEIVFKMTPSPKIQDLKYSILKAKHNKNIKALSSAVIYGPNASGKTNLIGAMEVLKSIVKRGHIRNEENESNSRNIAQYKLELIPNIKSRRNTPVKFRIKFICESYLVDYSLSIVLGRFLDLSTARKVAEEKLMINNKIVFLRKNNSLKIGSIESIIGKKYFADNFNKAAIKESAEHNLDEKELFLNSFKALYSNTFTSLILNWFEQNLYIIYNANTLKSYPEIEQKADDKEALAIDEEVNKAVSEFGFTGDILAYEKRGDSEETEPISIIRGKDKRAMVLNLEVFESYGTMRFANIFPLLREAMFYGNTIVIDEFDASLHPMALMSIINVFHNEDINKKGAQLIFNTHNPIFLNRNLFRRDEIKFVERNEESGVFEHYSLADFGTSGETSVRNTENYLNNYFVSKYGAIKDIDFTPVFERIMREGDSGDEKA